MPPYRTRAFNLGLLMRQLVGNLVMSAVIPGSSDAN
jgi:hypothetical protein